MRNALLLEPLEWSSFRDLAGSLKRFIIPRSREFLTTARASGPPSLSCHWWLRKMPPEQLGLWVCLRLLGAFRALSNLGSSNHDPATVSYLWGGAQRLLAFWPFFFHANSDGSTAIRQPTRALLAESLALFGSITVGV